MTDKQQKILQMTKDICRHQNVCTDVCKPISACDALRYAERAVEAGYVKVVRCKECKYFYESKEFENEYYCDFHGEDDEAEVFPDGYCNFGKPKMKGAGNE